jgi:hypothetical protein
MTCKSVGLRPRNPYDAIFDVGGHAWAVMGRGGGSTVWLLCACDVPADGETVA